MEKKQLKVISGDFGKLKNLKTLILSDNLRVTLPESIQKLNKLELLVASGNQLTALPSGIGKLKALRTLILTNNNFGEAEKERITKALPNCKVYF